MVTLPEVSPRKRPPQQRDQFPLRLRNRDYPLSLRPLAERRILAESDEQETDPYSSSDQDALRKTIKRFLSFPQRSESEFLNSAAIVRAFSRDMQLLQTMATQWRVFLVQLKAAQLDIQMDDDVPAEARTDAIDNILQKIGYEPQQMVDDGKPLSTTLLDQPQDVLFQRLQRVLRGAVNRFFDVMLHDLEQLADVRVVGLIDWTSDSVCRFHFFEHQLQLTTETKKERVKHLRTEYRGLWSDHHQEILKELAGKGIYNIRRIEEQLMRASSSRLEESSLPIPQRVTELIETAPKWLRPHLRVVEGEKFREKSVTLQRVEEGWAVTESRQNIETRFDPALTLFGEFVLAGWDDQQHARELERRIAVRNEELQTLKEKDESWEALCQGQWTVPLVAYFSSVLGAMLISLAFSIGNLLGVLVFAATPLALWPVRKMLAAEFTASNRLSPILSRLITVSCFVGLWVAVFQVHAFIHFHPYSLEFGVAWLCIASGLCGLACHSWLQQHSLPEAQS